MGVAKAKHLASRYTGAQKGGERWLRQESETAQSFPQHQAGSVPSHQGTRSAWRMPRDSSVWSQGGGESARDADQDSNIRSFAPEAMVRVLTQSASKLLTPVMMEAMANCPNFSGQREHLEDWVEKLERLLQVVTRNHNGCTLPDEYVTEILLQKLGVAYEAHARSQPKLARTLQRAKPELRRGRHVDAATQVAQSHPPKARRQDQDGTMEIIQILSREVARERGCTKRR